MDQSALRWLVAVAGGQHLRSVPGLREPQAESFQLEALGPGLFVNVPTAGQIAVIFMPVGLP